MILPPEKTVYILISVVSTYERRFLLGEYGYKLFNIPPSVGPACITTWGLTLISPVARKQRITQSVGEVI
jgi:hypothetical protein